MIYDFEQSIEKLRRTVMNPIQDQLVDKDEIIELLAVTALAGENLLLIGPPGTAKSQIVQDFARRLSGQYFECLLTRFSEPNELFGPIDLAKLKEGFVVTNTQGMLPEADFVFLDEVFNGNSAILNSLLHIMNERTFQRGAEKKKLPLMCLVGASNRVPDDPVLQAMYDRFLVRIRCDYVKPSSLPLLLERGWKSEVAKLSSSSDEERESFSIAELQELRKKLAEVNMDRIKEPYLLLVEKIRDLGVALSDRRLIHLLRLIAASSIFSHREEATPADFWVMRYTWEEPHQAEILDELVTQSIREYVESPDRLENEKISEISLKQNSYSLSSLKKRFQNIYLQYEKKETKLEKIFFREQFHEILHLSSWIHPKSEEEKNDLTHLEKKVRFVLDEFSS